MLGKPLVCCVFLCSSLLGRCSQEGSGVLLLTPCTHSERHRNARATKSSCFLQSSRVCFCLGSPGQKYEPCSWAESAPSPRYTRHLAASWEVGIQYCVMDTSALGMDSMNYLISCVSTTSPCSSSLLASVTSLKRLSVRPTSSTQTSTWCPTTWTSTIM